MFFFKTRLGRLRKAVWGHDRLCYDSLAINRGGCNYLIFLLEIVLMKKNVLALSIAAMVGGLGFAGAASAQSFQVNESGTGHILVVPYYTAQNGNMSVFHLTNTDTVKGKAVKVRFRGASNSDDVLDFQVFMSPGDVWTAAVTADAAGKAQLVTADNTCTLPAIAKNTPVPFVTDRLARQGWTDADKAAQTREGYVEILNMADISNVNAAASSLFKATKHVNGVAPCTSAVLQDTLLGYPAMSSNAELSAPTATLTGSWYVINVAQSTTFSGAAPALVGNAPTRVVFSPQVEGETTFKTSDPLMVAGTIKAQHYDVPDLSTPYFASQSLTSQTDADTNATNLTNALGRNTIMNQYATDLSISAKTDWVFSMPTRRYTVAANYASTATNYAGQLNVSATGTPTTSELNAYTYINSAVTGNIFSTGAKVSANDQGQLCVTASKQEFYDREENVQSSGAIFSPGTTKTAKLCGEVSVLSFTSDASALGAAVARQTVAAPYTNGWGTIGFGADRAPVLGAAFLKLTNPQAVPGTVGTYGITWPHAYGSAAQ
ncbi:cell surface protein [Delftia tsuruhatensis]